MSDACIYTPDPLQHFGNCPRESHNKPQRIMCIFCPDKPPDKVSRKGAGGAAQQAMLDAQNNPNVFAVGLKDACWWEEHPGTYPQPL